MSIRHPYNFVPLDGRNIDKEAWGGDPSGHERWESGRHSGTFVCRLRTLNLLCTKKTFEDQKGRNRRPLIPGSSLKGMLRSVAQVLGAGCGYKFAPRDTPTPLGDLTPCDSQAACLVCRMFGYSAEREDFGWAGKVRFSDAKVEGPWNLHMWQALPIGGGRWPSQGTRHTSFYFSHGRPLGWKVYRHAENPRAALKSDRAKFWTDACVGANTKFGFDVIYENLTDAEFALLRFALTLTHDGCAEHEAILGGHTLAHKLGYGKPAGLGSCIIEITDEPRENPKRYFGETEAALAAPNTCPLHGFFASPSFAKFREYFAWDTRPDHLLYPSKDWDQTRAAGWFDQNPRGTIAAYEAAVGNWQLVRITAVAPRAISSEVERNGTVYKGVSSPKFDGLAAGDTCWVWVTNWDDANRTYQGITA
jgi:RAMP superfamily